MSSFQWEVEACTARFLKVEVSCAQVGRHKSVKGWEITSTGVLACVFQPNGKGLRRG